MLLLAAVLPAHSYAFDRLVVSVQELVVGEARATDVEARLDLDGDAPGVLQVSAGSFHPGSGLPALGAVSFTCPRPSLSEPRLGCEALELAAMKSPIGKLALEGSAQLDTAQGSVAGEAKVKIAGGTLVLKADSKDGAWKLEGDAEGLGLVELRALLAPWVSIPPEFSLKGRAKGRIEARGRGTRANGRAAIHLEDLHFSNEAGTLVAEGVHGSIAATLVSGEAGGYDLALAVNSAIGQALAGPVLLDFGANPLEATASARWHEGVLEISDFRSDQPDLLRTHGVARVRIADGAAFVESADIVLEELAFPAAYTSFMQIALATTKLGSLTMSGKASGRALIEENAVTSVSATLQGVEADDEGRQLFIRDLDGEVHWVRDEGAEVSPSWLGWSEAGAYGLSGGAARLDFVARSDGMQLTKPARLPIFDGAVLINELEVANLMGEHIGVRFDADIEPISMAPLCRAFGWPEFAGTVSGRIPGLELRESELRVAGDIEAQVFGGTMVASNLRMIDPLGAWPRFFADVRGRGLELELITRTFEVGHITGRLDADILGLELFNWIPVAFDARIGTPPGDRSRRRISAKAVSNLADIGGGGNQAAMGLQTGVLRFFDEYRYSRLGIRCRLKDDVCLMSGLEPAASGFYLLQGAGIPRLQIIGHQGRVDWPRLVAQVRSAMNTQGDVVVR